MATGSGRNKLREKLLKLKIEGYIRDELLFEDRAFISLAPFYQAKARHNLETASLLFQLSTQENIKSLIKTRSDYEAFDWVISASYYAMFNASVAALGMVSIRAKTHESLIEALEFHFAHKNKVLENEYIEKIRSIKNLEDRYIKRIWAAKSKRNTAHYKAETNISRKDAEISLKNASEFVDRIEQIIADLK